MRAVRSAIILTILTASALSAHAQIARTNAVLSGQEVTPSRWSANAFYAISSDYADNTMPRAYTQALDMEVDYSFNPRWTLAASLGGRAETIDGQIDKGTEKSYDEVLNATVGLEASYGEHFGSSPHEYELHMGVDPLLDQASRREGYQGLIQTGGRVALKFPDYRYTMVHSLDVAEIANTYYHGSDQKPNPDYFYTYKFSNAFRVWRSLRATYTFGMKVTRYMDGFLGYAYTNGYGLAYTWKNLTASLTYENGGFTDDGEVRLWFIDEYRRVGRLLLVYTF